MSSTPHAVNASPVPGCVVSVIMPAYNAESYLSEAIQSFLDQDFAGAELLVINDGSKDRTAEVLARFSQHPQVRALTHPGGINRGVCASRHLALREARGEFIAFLDADDRYLPGKLARHIAFLREHPEIVLLHGAVKNLGESLMNGVEVEKVFSMGDQPQTYDLTEKPYFLRTSNICNSTVICRRSALRPEDLPRFMVAGYEDWLLWNCVALRGHFYYDPEPLSLYYFHPASFTYSQFERPGTAELSAIEFLLSVISRLPRLRLRLRAEMILVYKLMLLAEIRTEPPPENIDPLRNPLEETPLKAGRLAQWVVACVIVGAMEIGLRMMWLVRMIARRSRQPR